MFQATIIRKKIYKQINKLSFIFFKIDRFFSQHGLRQMYKINISTPSYKEYCCLR